MISNTLFRGFCVIWMLGLLLGTLTLQAQAAQLSGTILLEGPVPKPKLIETKSKRKDEPPDGCGHPQKVSPGLLVSHQGGIANAVVWLESEQKLPQAQRREVLLDQKECVFTPHVVLLSPGDKLWISNSDPVLHNIRIFDGITMLTHTWQKVGAKKIPWEFEAPGRYLVRCGVHLWMYAWAVVVPHAAAAISGPEGEFLLKAIPEGRHTLHVWHEKLGVVEQSVQVRGSKTHLNPIRFPPMEDDHAG